MTGIQTWLSSLFGIHTETDRCSAFLPIVKYPVLSLHFISEAKPAGLGTAIKGETDLEKKPWTNHCFSKAEGCYSHEIGPLRQLSSFTSLLLLCQNASIVGTYFIQSHPFCLYYEFINEKQYSFLKSFRIESLTVTHGCNRTKTFFWASNLLWRKRIHCLLGTEWLTYSLEHAIDTFLQNQCVCREGNCVVLCHPHM